MKRGTKVTIDATLLCDFYVVAFKAAIRNPKDKGLLMLVGTIAGTLMGLGIDVPDPLYVTDDRRN